MRFRITVILCLVLSFNSFAQQWPTVNREARPAFRWWWLGSAVEKETLKWTLDEYAAKGISAVEITPLYGVQGNEDKNIEFLSDKWMEMLRFVEDECAKRDIRVDMTTGTGWPFGGPWVPLEESTSKMVIEDVTVSEGEYSEMMDAPVPDKDEMTRFVGRYGFKKDNGDWRVITLWQRFGAMVVNRAAPGGEGWVIDHFNKKSVEHYLQYFEDAFERTGTPYPHTFFNDSYEVEASDYTTDLFAEFLKRRGYSLEENLDKLVDGDQKVVADYRETLGDLIYENFTVTWTEWAHRHGAITRNQAHGSPANLIDCYSVVDIPEIEGFGFTEFGIKGLREDPGNTRKNDSDFSMYKWASSAAHINAKPFTSSETFTWLTEHFRTSLSQMKPDLDLMFCAGVNHMFFHGAAYSPKDDPWPGWKFYASVDMSPTNTIWRDAGFLMEYITRCQSFLQWGEPDNDFLVYVPVRDMWNRNSTGNRLMMFTIDRMGKLAPDFVETIDRIDEEGYDCDYISERFLLTTEFSEGALRTAAGVRYKALIIPDENNILTPELREHIQSLKDKGAKIIYGTDREAMAQAAAKESIRYDLGLKTIRRSNPGGYHYFIANLTPRYVDSYTPLAVPFKNAVWFDPMTGERFRAEISGNAIRVTLKSGESLILETFNDPVELETTSFRKTEPFDGKGFMLKDGWALSFEEESPSHEPVKIGELRSWENIDEITKTLMGTGVYECEFKMSESDLAGSDDWEIDLGDVRESARVYINDTFVGCAWAAPFTLRFSGLLKPGKNTIRIEVTNLPANRISQMDRDGIKWRKMENINMVTIHYEPSNYADWDPVPSGLNSRVVIYKIR